LKNSGNSSAITTPSPTQHKPDTVSPRRDAVDSPRQSFALTGRSVELDPRTHAVRRDIADIRLAELVFAPHYAVPMPRTVARPVTLRSARDGDSAPMATLDSGDTLEVLEIAGKSAWGVARPSGLVGYVDLDAIDQAAPAAVAA
jgi:hypothetical protein